MSNDLFPEGTGILIAIYIIICAGIIIGFWEFAKWVFT